jgi:integrase
VAGRRRAVTLGYSPGMTAAAARELALQALADMRRGFDPAAESKARIKAAAAGEMTIAQLAERWMAEHVRPKLKPRTEFDYQRLLDGHLLPAVGRLTVARIEREDVNRLHVAMAHIPRRANYAVSVLRTMLNFAIDLGLRPPASNPARRIKQYREHVSERFLSEAEIARAAEAIEAAEQAGRIGPHGAAGLRLALLTGARGGEVTAIQWSHIDWDSQADPAPRQQDQ